MIAILSRNQILLSGLCSALAILLGYELAVPASAVDVPTLHWQPSMMSATLALAASFPPSDNFSAIDARPLFNPAREPVEVPQASAAIALPPPTDIGLIGVIIEGDRRMALLHTPESPLEITVTVGGTLNGWQVTAIEPDHIVLHAGSMDYSVNLNASRGASAGATDSSPGAPARSSAAPSPTNPTQTPDTPTESENQ